METTYIISASAAKQLPNLQKREVALIGRSNCGKSTLLNGLLQRRSLARTSRTPGRTQLIHFFGFGKDLVIADLPGYGFSAIGRDVRKSWFPLIQAYLQRPEISDFLFLFDCRRDLNEEDWAILHMLAPTQRLSVVLTKGDKMSRSQLMSKKMQLEQIIYKEIGIKIKTWAVSAQNKIGLDDLRRDLLQSEVPIIATQ